MCQRGKDGKGSSQEYDRGGQPSIFNWENNCSSESEQDSDCFLSCNFQRVFFKSTTTNEVMVKLHVLSAKTVVPLLKSSLL